MDLLQRFAHNPMDLIGVQFSSRFNRSLHCISIKPPAKVFYQNNRDSLNAVLAKRIQSVLALYNISFIIDD